MMAGAGVGVEEKTDDLPPDVQVYGHVTATTYLLMAVTGIGYLALTWSTVVLLGGFVTVLQEKDFWSLTVISMTQATRIFNALAEHLVPNFVSILARNIVELSTNLGKAIRALAGAFRRKPAAMSTWSKVVDVLYVGTIVVPFQAMSCVAVFLYGYSGPVVCFALALWRIAQRDYYGGDATSSSNRNLMPALDIFYSLVLLQGGLYMLWTLWVWAAFNTTSNDEGLFHEYRKQHGLPDEPWCRSYLARYISDAQARCWQEPASIRGRTLCDFAVASLDSGSWEDMLSAVRLLDAFVMQGTDVRSQLIPFRPRIEKLFDAMGWRRHRARKMREPAARIVAHLARDIRLAQFPGAMECISSLLLEATTRGSPGTPNELILQGLAILKGLALDDNNCRVICNTPGLLRKIMAPLSSASLIQDISNRDWADVVIRSFNVLYMLINNAPGKTSKRLRREIYSKKQSMGNLESIILEHGGEAAALEQLQIWAMGILTLLALDLSINLAKETKEKLIKKQLHIFLADGEEGQEAAAVSLNPLKEWAGITLLCLSKIESNTGPIMTAPNILGRLTGILDAKNTTYRRIAAQILQNLCAHCDLDKQWVKETLLPKVLGEILSSKRGTHENRVLPSPNDQGNQQKSTPRNDEDQNISTQQHDIEIQETSSTADPKKLSDGGKEQTTIENLIREAFLSLALVIREKLVGADDFDDAVQKTGVGSGAFVAKIKTIVEDNCQETDESLRIIKLCCRIVEPMMQRDLYAQHFKNKEFVESLSNASKIMSNLESCMLFAGTDFGQKNTMRPLLSDIQKRALHLVS